MIKTGKYFEEIVEMLTNFRSEIQAFGALGLLNINKHSEHFIQRILNLTYGYELDNLNKETSNFPGLDLGDTGEGIAFQISSTRKSEKIDHTLSQCLKYKHYEKFASINVFLLTSKQSSYSINTVTEPFFSFSPEKNIWDFNDLFKDIEKLPPSVMEILHNFIRTELRPTLDSIRKDEPIKPKWILDTSVGLKLPRIKTFYRWQSKVCIKNLKLTVPEILSHLESFFPKAAMKVKFLPMFNVALRKPISKKEVLFIQEVIGTAFGNIFHGHALLIEESTLTVEKITYSNEEMSSNLQDEMLMLLTTILFFNKQFEISHDIEVSILIESNTKLHFYPVNSFVIEHLFNDYQLESPLEFSTILNDVQKSSLAQLLQKIMYGFVAHEPTLISSAPFITIDSKATEFAINNIKGFLGIAYDPA